MPEEGYVLHSYGPEQRLHQAVASVVTLRRHDRERPVLLFCTPAHERTLRQRGLTKLFSRVEMLPEKARSATGFTHRLHRLAPFARTLFARADLVWCRDPDPLWRQLSGYDFTATGSEQAGFFFGKPPGPSTALDFLLNRRRRTLRRFGLTHLPRVRSGLLYVRDAKRAQQVCERAAHYLSRADETHFHHAPRDSSSSEAASEWTLAMAMSHLNLSIVPRRQGHRSPLLDFVEGYVEHDLNFRQVECRYYPDPLLGRLRSASGPEWLRDGLITTLSALPGRDDVLEVVPFALHFRRMSRRQPFELFATRLWRRLQAGRAKVGR